VRFLVSCAWLLFVARWRSVVGLGWQAVSTIRQGHAQFWPDAVTVYLRWRCPGLLAGALWATRRLISPGG